MKSVKQMLASLLENLRAELAADGGEEMCLVTLLPGEAVAIDYAVESCGGMGWVRLVSANPTVTFPNPDVTERSCVSTLAYQVEMGIIRVAHIGEEFQGEYVPPTDVELFNDADRQLDDMELMHRAISKSRGRDVPQMILGTYTPIGPEGGANGGRWQMAIGGDD